MKGKSMNITSHLLVPTILVLVCAGIAWAALSGKALPLISTPRAALVALLVVGMAACMGGIGQVGASNRWASPLAIAGYLLGVALLVVFAAAFTGWKIPLVRGDLQAISAVAVLMGIKYVIGTLGFLFHWL